MNRMWSVRHEARESLAHPGHGAFLKGCQKRITSSRLHHPTRSWLKLHVQAMSCFADFTRLSWVSQDFQKSLVGFTKLWFHKVWSNRMGHIYIYIYIYTRDEAGSSFCTWSERTRCVFNPMLFPVSSCVHTWSHLGEMMCAAIPVLSNRSEHSRFHVCKSDRGLLGSAAGALQKTLRMRSVILTPTTILTKEQFQLLRKLN